MGKVTTAVVIRGRSGRADNGDVGKPSNRKCLRCMRQEGLPDALVPRPASKEPTMIDQPRSPISGNPGPYRSNNQSETATRNADDSKHPPNGRVDVIAMVRSLQRTAGLADCFRKGNADCDDIDCDWRIYCLETSADCLTNVKRPPKK